jgi:nucleoside-diphosphate-sugar epimerase
MAAEPILLTGATGFVGGAVLRLLAARGRPVIAVSRQAPAIRHPQVQWRCIDLLQAEDATLRDLVGAHAATLCLHTAWYTNHADYLVAGANAQWLLASRRLADTFYRAGGRRFVGLGTCIEYDQAAAAPYCEGVTPLKPSTPYASAKAAMCDALAEHGRRGQDHAWARIFFIYGPGDRLPRLVPYLLDRLRRGEAVKARYGGLRRDYIHVDDLAAQLVAILDSGATGPINTGSGTALRLAQIFETAGDLFGRSDLVEANDAVPADDAPVIQADLTRFESAVGPVPGRSLRSGLADLMSRESVD